jgi:hypothetical protein
MGEGDFHIKLKKLQVLERNYAEEKTKDCHLYDRREDFVEFYAEILLVRCARYTSG